MGRTVIVGDVHGCRDELQDLLSKLAFTAHSDRLVLAGDLVARGPDSRGVVALAKSLGATGVRGNHDDRALLARRSPDLVSPDHRRVAEHLTESEWQWLESRPLWLALPDHQVVVVHAGVIPGRPVEQTPPRALLTMRALDSSGHWTDDKSASPLWGARYVGPPHVVFGHNSLEEPQLHEWATGIDTGCVYGNRLTALVLDPGEPPPRGRAVRSKLVSVAARRRYYPPK
jgi:hypothetical protein